MDCGKYEVWDMAELRSSISWRNIFVPTEPPVGRNETRGPMWEIQLDWRCWDEHWHFSNVSPVLITRVLSMFSRSGHSDSSFLPDPLWQQIDWMPLDRDSLTDSAVHVATPEVAKMCFATHYRSYATRDVISHFPLSLRTASSFYSEWLI